MTIPTQDGPPGPTAGRAPLKGLVATQEVVEIRMTDDLKHSLSELVARTLADKPLHRIVSMTSAVTGGAPIYIRVLVVIEYLDAAGSAVYAASGVA